MVLVAGQGIPFYAEVRNDDLKGRGSRPENFGFSDLMTVLFPSDHMTLLAFIFTLPLFPHSDSASCTHARKLHRCDAYVINSTNTHANCHGDSWRRPGPPPLGSIDSF